jgi:hypothetical protein
LESLLAFIGSVKNFKKAVILLLFNAYSNRIAVIVVGAVDMLINMSSLDGI